MTNLRQFTRLLGNIIGIMSHDVLFDSLLFICVAQWPVQLIICRVLAESIICFCSIPPFLSSDNHSLLMPTLLCSNLYNVNKSLMWYGWLIGLQLSAVISSGFSRTIYYHKIEWMREREVQIIIKKGAKRRESQHHSTWLVWDDIKH